MTVSQSNLRPDGRDSALPVLSDEGIVEEKRTRASALAVAFVTIDEFSKLCAASSRIEGTTIYDALTDHFASLLPGAVETYQLPRTGFVHLLDGETIREDIEDVLQRLVTATKSPLEVEDQSFNVSVSIGVARSSRDGDESLLDRAQFAQYQASKQTGSAYAFYDSEKAETIRDEVTLKNDLYTALEKDEFYLKYQPVVSLEDFTIVGAEALIRWEHPTRGLVSPGEFIPLAEKTGQILFLDRWVIENAVRQAARLNEDFAADLPIGINISAWQFRDNFLVDKIDELLEETNLPAHLFKIEVTETSMMQDVDRTGRVLQALEELGVQVALDDFGTGHATFEYLSQFPIDELKIDRSFLDFDDVYAKNQKLVDMMIQTGKRVDTSILAEGIETPEQLEFLRNRGCETAQGFLFAKPLSVSEFRDDVENGEPLYDPDA